MRRILLNASNLHVGGGVQVAASFLLELSKSDEPLDGLEVSVYASTEVDRNLSAAGFRPDAFSSYEVVDVFGLGALKSRSFARFRGFDLVFTIFGPLYLPGRVSNHLVGFAQPWIIYPVNEVLNSLSSKQRLMLGLKFRLQWLFFRNADRLIVELGHVKRRLEHVKGFESKRIDVVSNCVSALYFDDSLWSSVPALNDLEPDVIRLGFVTRDYAHKNLDYLPRVGRELARISGKRYRFYVTLNEHEWGSRSTEFKEFVTTVGPPEQVKIVVA